MKPFISKYLILENIVMFQNIKIGEESRIYLEYHKKPYRITHPYGSSFRNNCVQILKLLQQQSSCLVARAKFNYF